MNNMSVKEDLTGRVVGRLTVIERAEDFIRPNGLHRPRWLCRCECGNTTVVLGQNLKNGSTLSCGCLGEERRMLAVTKHGDTAGGGKHRLYSILTGMKNRCYDVKHEKYANYGGRGITICDEWLNSYENFKEWALSHGYRDDLTIDRINHDGNYEPDNCRWITHREQQHNKSTNHLLTYNGKTQDIAQWAQELDVTPGTLITRLRYGWLDEDVLTREIEHHVKSSERMLTYQGVDKSLSEWAREMNIDIRVLKARLDRYGMSPEEALSRPVAPPHRKASIYTFTYNGKTQDLVAWSNETGLQQQTIMARLKLGWSTEDALTKPAKKFNHRATK